MAKNTVVEEREVLEDRTPIDNVKMTINGNKMIIEIDLDENFGVSGSGKSIIIASTEGNQPVPSMKYRNVKIGLNVYKPVKK